MRVDQFDYKYELKIDLGNYQTGTVEFYVVASLDEGIDPDAAWSALQAMATRNVKTYAHRLRGDEAPQLGLGLEMSGVAVTKIGVGYGKKLKVGNGFGVSNRDLYGRIWGQLEPDDDPAKAAAKLWDYAVRAFEAKLASLTPATQRVGNDKVEPETGTKTRRQPAASVKKNGKGSAKPQAAIISPPQQQNRQNGKVRTGAIGRGQ